MGSSRSCGWPTTTGEPTADYEWDGARPAEAYARALWRVLALVSVRGSIAGVLAIAVIVDPDHGPDVDDLTRRLQHELNSVITSP
jgi:hypothetical protein